MVMLSRYLGDVRRNHALEHATVQLLLAKLGPHLQLVGRASGDGFFIYGNVPTDDLTQCAKEGLARLQSGEAFWAVTPLCGTNIATAGVMTAIASLAVAGRGRKGHIGSAIAAAMIAATFAQPIGKLIQQYLTTSPDLEGTEIVSVETRSNGRLHKVRTRRLAA
jgi:hypothetical protein